MSELTDTDVETVHALLDELAPACDARRPVGGRRIPCDAIAVYIVLTRCECGAPNPALRVICDGHLATILDRRHRHRSDEHKPHGTIVLLHCDRLRGTS